MIEVKKKYVVYGLPWPAITSFKRFRIGKLTQYEINSINLFFTLTNFIYFPIKYQTSKFKELLFKSNYLNYFES